MNRVKANNIGTPAAEFLVFSMANMKPKAPAKKTIRPMPGVIDRAMPLVRPIQAPRTVGTMDSASSQ
jgi:hypothetical protein